ncbi:MAG: hypothetical protein RLZ98_2359 [Pseudomonadota bacterium]|jgi:hypothetical protein
MNETALLFPVVIQVALTFVLLGATGMSRTGAVKSGSVKIADIALGQSVWPEQPTKFANAYRNQMELPVLFYVLVAFLLITRWASYIDLALAWVFVASRLVHAYIHVTSNFVFHRFRAFVVGVFALGAMWIAFLVRLISTGGM